LNKWLKNPKLGQDREISAKLEFLIEALSFGLAGAVRPLFDSLSQT
jgi:hypothetical protein